MANHTYGVSEIVGTSTDGIDAAISNGVAKAAGSVRNLDWFTVSEIRGHIADNAVADWQVTIKLGFRIEE
ncbi:dodecin [Occultella kanbiaonis]|uniref:dodecin n=1 Tax=Occultella kanbiaonis TaxID=2675754 RepID=UPI0012B796C1|nr:dodecin [Occultella kanbiaonis]